MGVENDEEFFVKPPEGSGSEVELPQRGTDGFEPDELVTQGRADVDPARVPSDPTVCRDLPDLEVLRVLERREDVGEGSESGSVDGVGRRIVEGLVGPDVIEGVAEVVEVALLRVVSRYLCKRG